MGFVIVCGGGVVSYQLHFDTAINARGLFYELNHLLLPFILSQEVVHGGKFSYKKKELKVNNHLFAIRSV